MNINFKEISRAAKVLSVLKSKKRQAMLSAIEASPGITMGELCSKLKMSQPMGSHYIGMMRNAGFVDIKYGEGGDGRSSNYYLNQKNLLALTRGISLFKIPDVK